MIARYASPVDAACLALCNQRLLSALGREVWAPFRSIDMFREQFLRRLARNLPSYIFCHICSMLHSREVIDPPGPAFKTGRYFPLHLKSVPSLNQFFRVHKTVSSYHFKIFHLQLAMKRYYHGPEHGVSTDSLQFTEVRTAPGSSLTTLLSVEVRICNGPNLCLRIQNWAVLDTNSIDRFLLNTKFLSICCDIGMNSGDQYLPSLVRSAFKKLTNTHTQSEDTGDPDILTCPVCETDYQLEMRRLNGNKLALVITKWLDIGAGLSPEDPKWRRHSELVMSGELRPQTIAPSGEVKRLFEKESGRSLDSLTRINELYLLDNRFKETLDWWTPRSWIKQGGKSLPPDFEEEMAHLFLSYLWRGCVSAVVIVVVYIYLSS